MREHLFKGRRTDNDEWVEGRLIARDVIVPLDQEFVIEGKRIYGCDLIAYEVDPSTVSESSELYDKNDTLIYEGDILQFDDDDGIWRAAVVFERGLFGLDVYTKKQVQNPPDWDMKHDRVKSRWWGCKWGYEEFGTAYTYRQPLAIATVFRGTPEEYQTSEQHDLKEKYGHGKYYVGAEVVGNRFDNPEMLDI